MTTSQKLIAAILPRVRRVTSWACNVLNMLVNIRGVRSRGRARLDKIGMWASLSVVADKDLAHALFAAESAQVVKDRPKRE